MATIHPSAVIDADVQLADDVSIGPNCVVEKGVRIGAGTILMANCVIEKDVVIGKNNHFYPACCIGIMPQILGWGPDTETGKLVIGDNNTFRENVTVHRSMLTDSKTEIGNDNLLMMGVHIAHDCILEDKLVITNLVQLGGHCRLETGAWISGICGLHQFVTVGKWCYIAGQTAVPRDVVPYLMLSGSYPSKVRGVNDRGVRRAGLGDDDLKNIFRAYKQLYRGEGTVLENARKLSAEENPQGPVREMIDAIENSSQHRYGRYREQFRH